MFFLNSSCQIQVHKYASCYLQSPEMSLGGNSRSFSDFCAIYLQHQLHCFSKIPRVGTLSLSTLFCISEGNPRHISPCSVSFWGEVHFQASPGWQWWMDLQHSAQKSEDSLHKISENLMELSYSYTHLWYMNFSLRWEVLVLLILTDHGGAPC